MSDDNFIPKISSNLSLLPPQDAGTLKQTGQGNTVRLEGERRCYAVTLNGTGKVHIEAKLDGVPVPYTDILQVDHSIARERFARKLAGPGHPELAAAYDLDLRQIQTIIANHTASTSESAGIAASASGEQLSARFDGLIDLVCDDTGRVLYLVLDANGTPRLADKKTIDGTVHVPPSADNVPFLIPSATDVQRGYEQDPAELWDQVQTWITSHCIPPKDMLDLLTAWVFHTHVMEHFDYSPVLTLIGMWGTGKTRVGESVLYVSRRPFSTEKLNQAQLFRLSHNQDATVFMDLADAWASITKLQSSDTVLLRYKFGAKVMRVLDYAAGAFRDSAFFDVYGPTIIGSNKPLPRSGDAEAFSSRCLHIGQRYSAEGATGNLALPKDVAALPQRAALIGWRAQVLRKQFMAVESPFVGRMRDNMTPLLQVTQLVRPDRLSAVVAAGKELDTEQREAFGESWEGRVIGALWKLRDAVQGGLLPVYKVRELANADVPERDCLNDQLIGNTLKLLGLKTRRYGASNRKHVEYDADTVESLARDRL